MSGPEAPARPPAPAGRAGAPAKVSLREKQKARTRRAIRSAAMRLFTAQGYDKTTVEQIAHEAEVSHTTFFRYFQTKEQVVLSHDLDDDIDAALAAIPAGLGHFDLLRRLIRAMYDVHAADEWTSDLQRMALIDTEPALREAYQLQKEQSIAEAAEFFAEYLDVDRDDFALRVFIAAVGGVAFRLMGEDDPGCVPDGSDLDRVMGAIDLLERGLPLV
ncbi:TetR family transcriptional regulator [Tomitella fengzijianii]|uniref:TetR family transcriptional regulator n=1 Tax=Tomitella fengzijianii TaxID=2597660 RepID=A0A516WZA3_9ACTN|nr:TetR family transcriptional regulator [Tomitella fengzijianii]QDQ96174.1 TetR family transcriptional regulator [Tomitella fengzijianii]